MGYTEDWSDFVPPDAAEVVELAGKWKHGWIPLDAAAIDSKMKGKTDGRKWWSSGGRAKPAGQVVGKKRRAQELESKPADRNRLQRNQNEVAGFRSGKKTGVLNSGQVPSAKAGRRSEALRRPKA